MDQKYILKNTRIEDQLIRDAIFNLEKNSTLGFNSNFLSIVGREQQIEYYSGIEVNNPSGNKNIKYIKYLDNSVILFTYELIYDLDDDIISVKVI